MDSVNQRTQLVGQNRLELLLFRLDGKQLYGINVFKVREVLQCPKLTIMPKSSPVVCGVANIRGATIPILDLALATGSAGLQDRENPFVIITEYNTKTQGFLVRSVGSIVNMNWEEIHPPPKGTGRDHYLTAVTRVDNQLVEIIDVEKILAEVAPTSESISVGVVDAETAHKAVSLRVLTVDDSSVARKQVTRCLQTVGVEVVALNDGRQALDYLRKLVDDGKKPEEEFLMMISDIEMPEMDGYTLTTRSATIHACKNCISSCILRCRVYSTRRWSRRSVPMTFWPNSVLMTWHPGLSTGSRQQITAKVFPLAVIRF